MLSENYNEKAQYNYYRALIAIRAVNDHDASVALNTARDAVLAGKHFTDMTDADLQQISPDLSINKFNALYGDYAYNAKTFISRPATPFVPASLSNMVEQHFAQFEEQFGDIRANPMRLKTWDEYVVDRPSTNNVLKIDIA